MSPKPPPDIPPQTVEPTTQPTTHPGPGVAAGPAARRAVPWWQSAPVLALGLTVVVLALALAWPLLRGAGPAGDGEPAAMAQQGLPWQVRPGGDGSSEVFGLVLGHSTLADVQARWGDDLVIALIAGPGQSPALEAYVEGFKAVFLNGKLVLATDADAGWLARAQARAVKRDIGEGAVRRYGLAADDLAEALRQPLVALAFVPAARLDEMTLLQRFGPAAQRLTGADGELQLMYPALGVAIALPPAGGEAARARTVIQYVAPRDFERRLLAPLLAVQAAASAASR